MKEFRFVYKSKPAEDVAYPSRSVLIQEHFNGDDNRFSSEVEKLIWDELTMKCVYDVKSGKVFTDLATADINPYGWRNA